MELLLTGEQSKNVSLVWKKSNAWKKKESLTFFLRKKLHFLTNNVHVLKNSWVDIEDMPRIPDVIYIVDPHKEQIAVKEAKNLVSQL